MRHLLLCSTYPVYISFNSSIVLMFLLFFMGIKPASLYTSVYTDTSVTWLYSSKAVKHVISLLFS